jgi:hypothetical protein
VWVYAEAECSNYIFVRVQCAAALRVKKLKYNIEMDSKEMAIMTGWTEI